jgi:hypothetical protein
VLQFSDRAVELGTMSFFPWAPRIQMLMTAHLAGDAPLPCVSPCVLMLIPPPAYVVESPKPVRKKIFMFSIAPSIVSTAVKGTPNAWKIKEAMAWAILL